MAKTTRPMSRPVKKASRQPHLAARVFGQNRHQDRADGGAEQKAAEGPEGRETADQSAPARLRLLDQENHRRSYIRRRRRGPGPAAAARAEWARRGRSARRSAGAPSTGSARSSAPPSRRPPRADRDRSPIWPNSRPPSGPRDEADRENAEGRDAARSTDRRTEKTAQPIAAAKIAVDAEIVPFHHIAGEARDDGAPFGGAEIDVHAMGGFARSRHRSNPCGRSAGCAA